MIKKNQASFGAEIYARDKSDVTFKGNCEVTINDHLEAKYGILYLDDDSSVL